MGFGLLLCAYFLLTLMSFGAADYAFVTFMLGALVATRAATKLKDYNPRFAWLIPVSGVYLLVAAYSATLMLDDLFLWDLPIRGAILRTVVDCVSFAAELAFSAIALWASAELAATVGLQKHRARAVRNLVFVGIWALGQALLLAVPALAAAGNGALMTVLTLYKLVVYLLNALLLYSCFSAICPQGEEFGKPAKPSRFKFINTINQKMDEKNEQARREYEARLAGEEQKFSAKNNNRHHKKKK